MKFESQFGLGEIVCTHQAWRGEKCYPDLLIKIVGITFQDDGNQCIICRLDDGHIQAFMPSELISDPAFDQEHGCYPPDKEES